MVALNSRYLGGNLIAGLVIATQIALLCGCGKPRVNPAAKIVEWYTLEKLRDWKIDAKSGDAKNSNHKMVFLIVRARLPRGAVWVDAGRTGEEYEFSGPADQSELLIDGKSFAQAAFFAPSADDYLPYKLNSRGGVNRTPWQSMQRKRIRSYLSSKRRR